ncbi:MAG: response regulator [Rubrobacteraceae bacterium]|nr:response regulator [Rubrobacteraceae bacterium]
MRVLPNHSTEANVTRRILAAVEDLLFKSKISETASQLGIDAAFPRNPRKLLEALRESPPDLLVIDLNSARFEPLALLRSVRSDEATRDVSTVGFLSHVQKDLAVAAREAGCDRVVARSAFTKDLQTGKWLEWLSPAPDRHRGP